MRVGAFARAFVFFSVATMTSSGSPRGAVREPITAPRLVVWSAAPLPKAYAPKSSLPAKVCLVGSNTPRCTSFPAEYEGICQVGSKECPKDASAYMLGQPEPRLEDAC